MKQRLLFILLIGVSSCGGIEPISFSDLVAKQPVVVSVSPPDGENAYDGKVVEISFSKPVDPKTITLKSFVITAVPEGEVNLQDLWGEILKEKIKGADGTYEVSSEDNRIVRFISDNPFPPSIRCGILVTPQVLSLDRLPLNQTPGEGPTPFFSSFYAKGVAGETSDNKGEPSLAPLAVSAVSRPAFLKLNEIFYDAVGSDTEGDLFVELLGEPDKSVADYQIIFVNGGDGKIVDTMKIPKGMKTNPEGFFVIADAITNQPGITKVVLADWVTNLDPPNGPDCVQLVDPEGQLVDVVGYGVPLVLRAENNLLCYEGVSTPDVSSGQSISRKPGGEDSKDNSKDWVANHKPTPGNSEIN